MASEVKCYPPDALLVNYMREKLLYETSNSESRIRKRKAKNATYSRLKKKKFDVIDRVFRSMANTVFFFKCIAEYPVLERVFEDDIANLLGLRRINQEKDIGFVFSDLMDYILIGSKEGRFGPGPDNRLDFRLILTHQVQKIIAHKIRQSSVGILAEAPRRIVNGHFDNVWAWTEMLSHAAEKNANYKVPPTRTFCVEELLGDETSANSLIGTSLVKEEGERE